MPNGVETEALALHESMSLAVEEGATTIFDSDNTVPVHIIRPGVGKGRGRHLYEASMLRANAHKFVNWRMFVDHLSPEARKAAGGLPRKVRDLGGRITEAWWDPNVPADPQKGYGQGAVVGKARPVRWMRELIEDDPALVEASISAQATSVKPVHHGGQRVWMVEGIEDRGSVDWVTEAGAGGRVAPLIESSYASEEAVEMALLESMSDEEFVEYVREQRPSLNIAEADGDGDGGDGDGGDIDPAVQKLIDKGMSRKQAEAFAKNKKTDESADQEGDMPLTKEQLQEALSPEILAEALDTEAIQVAIDARVRTALSEDRALANAERDAVIDRQWELRDLRDSAHQLIAESRLPESWQENLKARFALREDRSPTPDLDVVDDIDGDGAVTKSAAEKLREAVEGACKEERRKLAEVAPTRVRGQGAGSVQEGEDGDKSDLPPGELGYHRTLLAEAGIDFDKAYEGV